MNRPPHILAQHQYQYQNTNATTTASNDSHPQQSNQYAASTGHGSIYDTRMSEFCMNYFNHQQQYGYYQQNTTTPDERHQIQPYDSQYSQRQARIQNMDELQRPKCAISPINNNSEDPATLESAEKQQQQQQQCDSLLAANSTENSLLYTSSSMYPMSKSQHIQHIQNGQTSQYYPCSTIPSITSLLHNDSGILVNSSSSSNNLSSISNGALSAVSSISSPYSHTTVSQRNTTNSAAENFSSSAANSTSSGSLFKSVLVQQQLHNSHYGHFLRPVQSGPVHFQSTPNKDLLLLNLNQNLSTQLESEAASSSSSTSSTHMPHCHKTGAKSSSKRINFHSILDLAKSADSVLPHDGQTLARVSTPVSASIPETTTLPASLTFNENLQQLSLALQNKENTNAAAMTTNSSSVNNNNNVKRKPRTQITKKQREILEYAYNMKTYPDANEVEYLCHILGFEENVIRVCLLLLICLTFLNFHIFGRKKY